MYDIKYFGVEILTAALFFERLELPIIEAAFRNLARGFDKVSHAIAKCREEVEFEQKILNLNLEIFKNPKVLEFTYGSILNLDGSNIYAEINQALSDFRIEKYSDFGFQIGMAMGKLLHEPEPEAVPNYDL